MLNNIALVSYPYRSTYSSLDKNGCIFFSSQQQSFSILNCMLHLKTCSDFRLITWKHIIFFSIVLILLSFAYKKFLQSSDLDTESRGGKVISTKMSWDRRLVLIWVSTSVSLFEFSQKVSWLYCLGYMNTEFVEKRFGLLLIPSASINTHGRKFSYWTFILYSFILVPDL